MKAVEYTNYGSTEALPLKEAGKPVAGDDESADAFAELERGVQAALATYANVHRGSGHNSLVTTHLYEQAREIVLGYLGLDPSRYIVIFSTPRNADLLQKHLAVEYHQILSSEEIGLPLGLRALAVKRCALPKGLPRQTGGGTARLVSPSWVVWTKAPDLFEPGTPAIINVIAFARALQLIRHFGPDAFRRERVEFFSAAEILSPERTETHSGRDLLTRLRNSVIGKDNPVPTANGFRPFTNLDNAASTRAFSLVWDTVRLAWGQPRPVQAAIVHQVKKICADFVHAPCSEYEVLFTSNTTEAINLAAENLQLEAEPWTEPVIVNTLLEHNSNELPWRILSGVTQLRLKVDAEGFLDPDELEELLCSYNQRWEHGNKRIKLVAVSGASNVLGSCNDLAEIGRIVRRYGARFLVDAAQLIAHRPIFMDQWGIDYLAFSAHKAYAPFGTGVLLARRNLMRIAPGERARIDASGEENIGGIAGLGSALLLLQRIGLEVIQDEEQALTALALRGLAGIPGLEVYGVRHAGSPRFPRREGVIVFRMPGMMANQVGKSLAERGIGVRTGCHCAHMLIKRLLRIPPFLEQFQGLIVSLFPRLSLPGLTRVSLGIENTPGHVDRLIEVLADIVRKPRQQWPQKERIQRQMTGWVTAVARRVYAPPGKETESSGGLR